MRKTLNQNENMKILDQKREYEKKKKRKNKYEENPESK